MTQTAEYKLSHSIEPLCPRDDHAMKFETKGIAWKAVPEDKHPETLPSYHCNHEGCSVRYDAINGYFTVVLTPDQPFFIEEPSANVLQCPAHGSWLYRATDDDRNITWRCGVEGCDYSRTEAKDPSNPTRYSPPPGKSL
jgi:hypothetical protein